MGDSVVGPGAQTETGVTLACHPKVNRHVAPASLGPAPAGGSLGIITELPTTWGGA